MPATIISIENNFLHGNLDEQFYMGVAPEVDGNSNQNLILRKTINDVVKIAKGFYWRISYILS
jgi:hypothetical protein